MFPSYVFLLQTKRKAGQNNYTTKNSRAIELLCWGQFIYQSQKFYGNQSKQSKRWNISTELFFVSWDTDIFEEFHQHPLLFYNRTFFIWNLSAVSSWLDPDKDSRPEHCISHVASFSGYHIWRHLVFIYPYWWGFFD